MKYLRDIPKPKLQKAILVLVASLGVCGAIYEFYLSDRLNALSAGAAHVQELQTKIKQAEMQARSDQQDGKRRGELLAFTAEQRTRMISGDPFSWCVREITLLAEKHPVHVLGLQPGARGQCRVNSHYETYSINFEVDGTYDQLGAFVQALENTFATAEIRGLGLQCLDPAGLQRRLSLGLVLLVLPEPKAVESAAKKPSEKG